MKQTVQEAQEPLAQRINPAARLGVPSSPPLAGRVVAIVHPAWHSCGSHQVFVSQARAYRSLGAKVISVAIAVAPGATDRSNQHKAYMAATPDLEADLRLFTGIPLRMVLSPRFPRAAWRLLHGNFAEVLVDTTKLVPIPDALARGQRVGDLLAILAVADQGG